MDIETPTLSTLFNQLGLPSGQADIDDFVQTHPLSDDVKLVDGEFWNDSQAALLKEKMGADDDWAQVVDELNELLHPERSAR